MPPGVAAAGATIAGGAANAISSSKAQKAQRKQTNRATGYFQQALDTTGRAGRRAYSLRSRGADAAVGGYDDAIRSFGNVGRGATQSILDARKAQLDGVEAQGIRSGLASSQSTMRSAQRGVYTDSQRSLLAIQDALGQNMAQLQIGRGNAVNQGNTGLAGIVQNTAGAESDILQRLAAFLGNIQHTGGGANFQGIGDLLELLQKKPQNGTGTGPIF